MARGGGARRRGRCGAPCRQARRDGGPLTDRETAWAKINLALHVRARQDDGYHRIETLFAFAEEGDMLAVEPGDGVSLSIGGPFGASLAGDGDNLVIRAATALQAAFGATSGARLHLDKLLPVAAGIGGGSADAAAALRLLARHWRLPSGDGRIMAIARDLGADVPACVAGVTVRGDGRGDALTAIDGRGLSGRPLLLVNPGLPLATGPVFAAWDGIDRGGLGDGAPLAVALEGRNDLEIPAIGLCPPIAALLEWLPRRPGAMLARMSGSGATCFAIFDDAARRDAAAAEAREAFPSAWCLATALR